MKLSYKILLTAYTKHCLGKLKPLYLFINPVEFDYILREDLKEAILVSDKLFGTAIRFQNTLICSNNWCKIGEIQIMGKTFGTSGRFYYS